MNIPDEDRRRVYLWMDLNIPYYGTSSSNHKAELGSRRMYPLDLDATLSEVAVRRCAACHQGGVPRKFYTRVLNPEKNSFLLAPLAKEAGGTQRCGQPVFASTADPDYQQVLRTFDPIRALLRQRHAPTCRSSRRFARSRSANHEFKSPAVGLPPGEIA